MSIRNVITFKKIIKQYETLLLTNVDHREAPYDPKQKRKAKLLLFSIMHAVPFLFLNKNLTKTFEELCN